MQSMREAIADARKRQGAIGHFNVSDLEGMKAIVAAGKAAGVPVIIGTSEGEADFVGMKQAAALVRSFREGSDFPIFLNADHVHSLDRAKEALSAGYDSVTFDRSELSLEENIKSTKEMVDFARKEFPEAVIEGELGYIGGGSRILSEIPGDVKLDETHLTKPEEAAMFAKETGVDLLAPAVGNMHGMLQGGADPALNIKRVEEIYSAAGVPLVLHGGSGNSEEDYIASAKSGVAIIHINTELRAAWKHGLIKSLDENREEIAPYKIMRGVIQEIEKVVEKKISSFGLK